MKQTIIVAAIMLTANAIQPKRTEEASSVEVSDKIFENIQKNFDRQHELLATNESLLTGANKADDKSKVNKN